MDVQGRPSSPPWPVWGIAAVLLLAPLIRGGNRPIAMMILELAASLLLAHCLWRPHFRRHLPRGLGILLAALLLLPLFYLVPIPVAAWASLPGRELYAEVMRLASLDAAATWRAAAISPLRTETAWLALLPPLAVFLATVGLPTHTLKRLTLLFLGVVLGEALLGLAQYGAGPHSLLRLGNPWFNDSAVGTYANRNHLAGLLVMALPLGLSLLLTKSIGGAHAGARRRPWRRRIDGIASRRIAIQIGYGGWALVVLLGILFTRSRMGIALAVIGVLLVIAVYVRRGFKGGIVGPLGAVALVCLAIAATAGLAPIWQRFAAHDPLSDVRWSVFAAGLRTAGTFFPLGSGPGTFADVFMPFQPLNIAQYVNHAHNDYLEWFIEGGLLAVVIMAGLLGYFIARGLQLWMQRPGTTFDAIQIGAGIGMSLLLIHGLMDFNFHIPANAIYFAFLAALYFHHPKAGARSPSVVKSPRRRRVATTEAAAVTGAGAVKNPFND